MITWLTLGINDPELDREIIVKSSNKMNFDCVTSSLRFYSSKKWTKQEMLDFLETDEFNVWSYTK